MPKNKDKQNILYCI